MPTTGNSSSAGDEWAGSHFDFLGIGAVTVFMLVIYTKIDAPGEDFIAAEREKGNRVLHIPALTYAPTGNPLNFLDCDSAFVGSPRAAAIAKEALKNFAGPIFTAGPRTARFLLQQGISVASAGTEKGARDSFPRFLEIRKVQNVAWISALETAADLKQIAAENQVRIRHFPVYKTQAAKVDEQKMQSLEHPLSWHFYSGKAVKAMSRFIQEGDLVNLHGASAEKAFALAQPCR